MPVPGGYQGLAELLAAGLDVRLNHRVAKIQYGPQGARVTCTNGVVLDADVVLVTTLVGVLQAHRLQLEQQKDDIEVTLAEIAQHEARCRELLRQAGRKGSACAPAARRSRAKTLAEA